MYDQPVLYSHRDIYLADAFSEKESIGDGLREWAEDMSVQFDTLVGTGMSGTLVVPSVADLLGVNWAIVRKEPTPHTPRILLGDVGRAWLFVDDFISSGATLRRVMEIMSREVYESRYAGCYFYGWKAGSADDPTASFTSAGTVIDDISAYYARKGTAPKRIGGN